MWKRTACSLHLTSQTVVVSNRNLALGRLSTAGEQITAALQPILGMLFNIYMYLQVIFATGIYCEVSRLDQVRCLQTVPLLNTSTEAAFIY